MSDLVLASIISAGLATGATLLTAWFRSRGHPTRTIVNAKFLLDSTGTVILQLNEQIKNLEDDFDEARAEARAAQEQAKACNDRINRLEAFLRSKGVDPTEINGPRVQ